MTTWKYTKYADDFAYADEQKVIHETPIHTIWTKDGDREVHLGWARNCTNPKCQPTPWIVPEVPLAEAA